MTRRFLLSFVGSLIGVICYGFPALAGGGGFVTSFEAPPATFQARQSTPVNFQVNTACTGDPVGGLTPHLTATNLTTGETIEMVAQSKEKPGQYVVEMRFPQAGEWQWRIVDEEFLNQRENKITVGTSPFDQQTLPIPATLGLATLILGVGVILICYHAKLVVPAEPLVQA